MTIRRAREIMGDELADKSDAEVLDFIQTEGAMADAILDIAVQNIREGKTVDKNKTLGI